MTTSGAGAGDAALIRVVSGSPTDDELAAVVVAIAALQKAATETATSTSPAAAQSGWAARSHLVRRPLHPGPDQWKAQSAPL